MRSPANKIILSEGDTVGECIYVKDSHSISGRRYCIFICHCGKEFIAGLTKVKSRHTKSCGCNVVAHLLAMNKTHGLTGTSEFNSWVAIKNRCNNPNYERYSEWGGRGITMCEEWKNSFQQFYEDMGAKPKKGYSVERMDNNKGYYKGNCYWATPKEQSNNRRSNVIVFYKGESMNITQWCKKLNIKGAASIMRRIRMGWTAEDAFEKPFKKN